MKKLISAFAALAAFAVFGIDANTIHDNIPGTATVSEIIAAGGGFDVDTNVVRDIIHATVDGSARPLPRYLHALDFADSYPDAAAEYYRSRGNGKTDGGCSAVRSGGFLYRNFDYPFDERAEFVVKMSAGPNRFASVGVAQVGTNLMEAIVTSGKPSRCYKWLPGATVDGINENGVICEINVVDGDPQTSGWHTGGDIHPLAAVRWALDRGETAAHVASNLAARVSFPAGWTQNFHYMVADERETWIVENGSAHAVSNGVPVMTNFRLYPTRDTTGAGQERYDLLAGGANITNAWYTRAYLRSTNWVSEFKDAAEMEAAKAAWETHEREQLRGKGLWQSVHTSIYDITNRVLRVAVQETDDFYTFAVPAAGGVKPEAVKEIVEPMIAEKLDKTDVVYPSTDASASGKAADAKDTGDELADHNQRIIAVAGVLSSKADKVQGATSGNFAAFDGEGNLTDSGWDLSRFYASFLPVEWAMDPASTFAGSVGSAPKLTDTNYDKELLLEGYEGDMRWGEFGYGDFHPFAYVSELPQDYAAVSNAAMWASNAVAGIKISADDSTFSNAVLAVGLNIDTNSVAVLNEIAATFGDFPIDPTTGATTIGALLAALAAAVAWLRKRTDTIAAETAGKREKTDLEVYEEDPETGELTPTGETLATSGDLGGKQDALSVQQLANIADVQNKVAKETGKGLSTNDYTTADKQLVAGAFQKSNIVVPSSENLTDNQVLGAASAKEFINSSVQTATANFRGNFADWTAVPTDPSQYEQDAGGSRTPTTNDYMVVINAEGFGNYTANVSTGIIGRTLAVAVAGFAVGHVFVVTDIATLTAAGVTQVTLKRDSTWRFKYTGLWSTDGKAGWSPEYRVNEAPLTAAQLAALNSGVTSDAVQKADGALRFDAAQSLTDGQKAQLWANLGLDDFNGEEF